MFALVRRVNTGRWFTRRILSCAELDLFNVKSVSNIFARQVGTAEIPIEFRVPLLDLELLTDVAFNLTRRVKRQVRKTTPLLPGMTSGSLLSDGDLVHSRQ